MSRREEAMLHGAGEPAEPTWHAAVTHQGREFAVRESLQAKGIDTVLPVIRYWRVRNRRRFVAERPLLPNTILFCIDRSRQSLIEMVERYDYDAESRRLVPSEKPDVARPMPGIERIVRGASDQWAVLPAEEVYELRLGILRGDFDATRREDNPRIILPRVVRWLLENGELPAEAAFTHKQAARAGLKFSVAA